MLKWRLRVKADIEEKAATDAKTEKKPAEAKTEDEEIDEQIKEAVYNEKKLDKK